jgi:hypothetical protein
MDNGMSFLAVVGLPEKTWGKNLGQILGVAFFAVIFISCAVTMIRSYRQNRFCPCCSTKMTLGWRTEKKDPRKERVTFGGKRVIAGTVTNYIPVLRCPKCGWEIDLGK